MAINKKEYPLALLTGFKNLLEECRSIADRNSQIIDFILAPESFFIQFKDKDPNSKFRYLIQAPAVLSGKIIANISRFPRNANDLTDYNSIAAMSAIPDDVANWVHEIEMYNVLSFDSEDDILNKYQQEYYTEFKSTDADADTSPFDEEKQAYILKFLENIEANARDYPEQTEEIIQITNEAESLKNTIQRQSKNKTIEGISRLAAKIKMQAPGVVKAILKTVKDETIKFVIKQLLENGQHYLTNIHLH